jgi:enoyl-CoA hydratase/carnithine racemase
MEMSKGWDDLQAIEVEREDAIVTIRLNRARVVNAIDWSMETEINQVLKESDEDDGIKCVLITANGVNFSAGHDIRQVAEEAVTGTEPATIEGKYWARTGELLPAWWFRKALVMAVKGFVGPHANAFLLSADAVVAADNTMFSWEETRIGIGSPYGPYALMPFYLPMRVLKHLWIPGGWMDAETALRLFYINRVVPVGEEEAMARRFAEHYATMDLEHLIVNKQGVHRLYEAAGLLSMVDAGREPYERQGAAAEALLEHFRIIHEQGAGAAARTRDTGVDREISKV